MPPPAQPVLSSPSITATVLITSTLIVYTLYYLVRYAIEDCFLFASYKGNPLGRIIRRSLHLVIVLVFGLLVSVALGAFGTLAILVALFGNRQELFSLARDLQNNGTPLDLLILTPAIAYLTTIIIVLVRNRALTKNRDEGEWSDWFPDHLRRPLFRRAVFLSSKVIISYTLVTFASFTYLIYGYILRPRIDIPTSASDPNGFDSFVSLARSTLVGNAMSLVLLLLVTVVAFRQSALLAAYLAFRYSDPKKVKPAWRAPNINVDLRGFKYKSQRHRHAFFIASCLQRGVRSYRWRVTAVQYNEIFSTCNRIAALLRRAAVADTLSELTPRDLANLYRASVAILIRDDIVAPAKM